MINLNDNFKINAGKPIDSKYLNGVIDYSSISEVNLIIPQSERYLGLTVRINGVEYWYKNGKLDTDLVVKSIGFSGGLGDLSDVNINNVNINDVLVYDGVKWTNTQFIFATNSLPSYSFTASTIDNWINIGNDIYYAQFNHNLNTKDICVEIYEMDTNGTILVEELKRETENTLGIYLGGGTSSIRVIVWSGGHSGTYSINSKINTITYVSSDFGNDSTGERGNILKPYKTITSAINSLNQIPNEYIHVYPGNYNEDSFDLPDNLTIYFDKGTFIKSVSNSGKSSIFSDLIGSNAGPKTLNILGNGSFFSYGSSYNDTNCFCSSYDGSYFYIEADYISSVEAWNGGYMSVKNATIEFETEAYNSGELYFDNCKFINFGSVNRCYSFSSFYNDSLITYNNCYFEKNGPNLDYIYNFQSLGRPIVGTVSYDLEEVISYRPFDIENTQSSLQFTFNNCTFVQKRNNCDIIRIQSGIYSTSSFFQFNNCKFYSINSNRSSILYTSLSTNGYPVTTGYETQISFMFSGNISNCNYLTSSVIYPITNIFSDPIMSISPLYKIGYNPI
jgi:hypothetical protein